MGTDRLVAGAAVVATNDDEQASETEEEPTGEGDPPDDDSPVGYLPTTGSTTTRAAAAWWVVFAGPVVVTLALLTAGIVADQRAVVLVFTLGVWAYSLTLGLAAAPRIRRGLWWVGALAVAFASAIAAFGLLYLVSALSDNLQK